MGKGNRRNIDYTISSFAIEGLRPSDDAIRLYEKMEDGKISLREVLREIERKYQVAGRKRV